jgi:hypothetical protein
MQIERTARARQKSRISPEIAADTPKEDDPPLVERGHLCPRDRLLVDPFKSVHRDRLRAVSMFAFKLAHALTSAVRRFNSEIVEFLSGPELRSEPAGLLPAPRPSLGRPPRIPKLRNHFGVRTPCAADMLVALEQALTKLSQSLLKPSFLGRYLACQD